MVSPHGSAVPDQPAVPSHRLRVFLGGPIQHLLTAKNSAAVVAEHRAIARTLIDAGYVVLSAHEVEEYGQLSEQFTPASVTQRDYRWAQECDVYVAVLPVDHAGVPYRSDGTHIEIGWATALDRPVVLLLDENAAVPYSHLVRGLVDTRRAVAVPLQRWRTDLLRHLPEPSAAHPTARV